MIRFRLNSSTIIFFCPNLTQLKKGPESLRFSNFLCCCLEAGLYEREQKKNIELNQMSIQIGNFKLSKVIKKGSDIINTVEKRDRLQTNILETPYKLTGTLNTTGEIIIFSPNNIFQQKRVNIKN